MRGESETKRARHEMLMKEQKKEKEGERERRARYGHLKRSAEGAQREEHEQGAKFSLQPEAGARLREIASHPKAVAWL
jgi:hypothetical protein